MRKLLEKLIKEGVLKTPEIIAAFFKNDRKFFVPEELVAEAYVDAPLPIGQGQTISQPYTVAFMIELLDPRPGQKILDIGFGSGWTTAILASIVGKEGRVYGLEIVPEVFAFGKANLERHFANQPGVSPHPFPLRDRRGSEGEVGNDKEREFRISNVVLFNKSGWEGLPQEAPFDRILVSAAAPEAPKALKEQLAMGGKMVLPVGPGFASSIKLLQKIDEKKFKEQDYPGFAFVPFVKK